jgi:hypothetical protein
MWLYDHVHDALWSGRDAAPVLVRLLVIFGLDGAEMVIQTAALGPPGRVGLAAALAGVPAPGVPWGSPWGSPWTLSALWRRLETALAARWRPPSGDIASASNRAEAARLVAAYRVDVRPIWLAQARDGGRTWRHRLAQLLVGPPQQGQAEDPWLQ